jgi:hypothetical protein
MVVYPRVLLKVTFAVQTGWWLDQEPTEQQRNRDNQESMINTLDSSKTADFWLQVYMVIHFILYDI